jgi:hypothetical protein
MLLNVALFMPAVVGGFLAAWVGWRLTRPDEGDGGWSRPPDWHSPVAPTGPAGRDDLARSA